MDLNVSGLQDHQITQITEIRLGKIKKRFALPATLVLKYQTPIICVIYCHLTTGQGPSFLREEFRMPAGGHLRECLQGRLIASFGF